MSGTIWGNTLEAEVLEVWGAENLVLGQLGK